MPRCWFERATGRFVSGAMYDDLGYDPATHIELVLPAYPDRVTERWDGGTGVRPATAGELQADEVVRRDADIDGAKTLRAVAEWTRRELNLIRAALPTPKPAIAVAEMLEGRPEQPAGIKDIYRAL